MSNKHPTLIEQNQALSAYFDALLREDEEEIESETAVQTREQTAPVIAPPVIAPLEVPQVEPQTAVETEAAEEGPPAWAAEEFQALLFRVGGLMLAVPLSELHGIQVWHGEKVTPMPGHVDWYLGLMTYREHSVPIIDTAQLVLPEDRLARLTTGAQERVNRIVFIDEGRWGLACDDVDEVITLTRDQVRWRTSRTRRRWLAGTVIDHMCAIIDPPAFAEMLATGMEDLPEEDPDTTGGSDE